MVYIQGKLTITRHYNLKDNRIPSKIIHILSTTCITNFMTQNKTFIAYTHDIVPKCLPISCETLAVLMTGNL